MKGSDFCAQRYFFYIKQYVIGENKLCKSRGYGRE